MAGQKRTALKHIGVKESKEPKRYRVEITEEQIALIRAFSYRTEMLYIRHNINRVPDEKGEVVPVQTWECFFCYRASYESAAAIPHKEDCIVPFSEREYGALNGLFLAVEHPEADSTESEN
jgi:hypothetical protein